MAVERLPRGPLPGGLALMWGSEGAEHCVLALAVGAKAGGAGGDELGAWSRPVAGYASASSKTLPLPGFDLDVIAKRTVRYLAVVLALGKVGVARLKGRPCGRGTR